MESRLWRASAVLAAIVVVPTLWACQEGLKGGAACPNLCPGASVVVHDTEFDGATVLTIDTTVDGYSPYSGATEFLVATGANTTAADSLDVRAIIRFDSVTYQYDSISSALISVTYAESAFVRIYIDTLMTQSPKGVPITVAAYDVDTIAGDTSVSRLASLFTPSRYLGSATFTPGARGVLGGAQDDSITIYLNSAMVLAHLTGDHLIRVGFQITSAGPAWFDILKSTVLGTGEPVFSYMPSPDTLIAPLTNAPNSTAPSNDSTLAADLVEYSIAVVGTGAPALGYLTVGGLPAARAYFKFNLPSRIVDSTSVVRATITLTHIASPIFAATDTMIVFPYGILSTGLVTDPGKSALFLAPTALIGVDTTRLYPALADTVNVEFANAIAKWKDRGVDTVQRVIVVAVNNEGATPYVASFYAADLTVPISLRPHIHIAYVNPVLYPLP